MTPNTARLGGLAALLTLALSGCGLAADSPKEPSAPSVATPRDELIRAVPDEKAPAFAFDIKGGGTPMSGVLDSSRKTAQLKIVQSDADITLTMALLMIDDKSWIKIGYRPANLPGMPRIPNKWLVVDPARLTDKKGVPTGYDGDADPGDVLLLVQNAGAVTAKGPGRYAGTTDLTASGRAEIVDKATLTKLGEKAKSVPFEAVVDSAGRLTLMLVRVPAATGVKASTYRVSYTGFGTTEVPGVPTGSQQTRATSAVYDLLNA